MVSQLSTSASDAILAISAYHATFSLILHSIPATIGFLLIAFAATAGVFRFGLSKPTSALIHYHKYLSWLASVIGMSCLAAAFHRKNSVYFMANLHLASGITLVLLDRLISKKVMNLATDVISNAAIVSIMGLSLVKFNAFGLIGAGIYAVSGLAIGTEGNRLFGMRRVDLFHYGLVIGNVALMKGIENRSGPIYYRPSNGG